MGVAGAATEPVPPYEPDFTIQSTCETSKQGVAGGVRCKTDTNLDEYQVKIVCINGAQKITKYGPKLQVHQRNTWGAWSWAYCTPSNVGPSTISIIYDGSPI